MKKYTLHLIIGALVFLNFVTLSRLNRIERTLENSQQQFHNSESSLSYKIDTMYSNIDTMLKKQGSVLDSYDVDFGEFDSTKQTVPITLTMTPKKYSEQLNALLQLNNIVVPMKNEGTSFIGTIDAHIFDKIDLKVILDQNGIKSTESLQQYFDLRDKYILNINGGFTGQSTYGNNKYSYDGKIDLSLGYTENNSAVKITIVKEINGKVIDENIVETSAHISLPLKDNLELLVGDKFIIYALIKDRYDLSYKYIVSTFGSDSKGEPLKPDNDWSMRGLEEITDKNGSILYSSNNYKDKK